MPRLANIDADRQRTLTRAIDKVRETLGRQDPVLEDIAVVAAGSTYDEEIVKVNTNDRPLTVFEAVRKVGDDAVAAALATLPPL